MNQEETAKKTAQELKKWLSTLQTAKLNRNVDSMIAEMSPGLNKLSEAHIAAFVFDFRQSSYRYFNSYFPEIFQVDAELIKTMGFQFMQQVTHPEDFLKCLYITRQAVMEFAKMKSAEQQASHFRVFYRIRRKGDTWLWVMQSNRTYNGEDNMASFNVGFIVELFGNQHPFKVMGVLETPGRTLEIFPDLGTEKLSKLSYREIEILQLARAGLSSKDISAKLNITENTVKAHRKNLLKKLEVNNMVQAAAMLDNLG